jgi:hypothetical protein
MSAKTVTISIGCAAAIEHPCAMTSPHVHQEWGRIPTQSGHRFRFEAGHRSDLMSATIPK